MGVQIIEARTLLSIRAQDGSGDRFEIDYSIQNGRLIIGTHVLANGFIPAEQTTLYVPLPEKFRK